MKSLFIENPLIAIFTVAAVGYLFGTLKIKGNGLGVSATLFVGLLFGAVVGDMEIPDVIFELGLVFFVYSIGLSSGPAFFKSVKKNGVRDILFISFMLAFAAMIAFGIAILMGFSGAELVGIYSGSSTNTPALASVIDHINLSYSPSVTREMVNEAVIAYSYTYPMGILGSMLAIIFMSYLFKIDFKNEQQDLKSLHPSVEDILSKTILVSSKFSGDKTLRELAKKYNWDVVFGRVKRENGDVLLMNWDLRIEEGDKIVVIGTAQEIEKITNHLGQITDNDPSYDREEYDVRGIFVSNADLVGRTISSLNLDQKFEVNVTRIRRGDQDMLAKGNTVLELGDRIRLVAKRDDISDISNYFGDSYYQSSRVNLFSFGFGIALGLMLGIIEFSLPMGIDFKLGFAGGPLIVGLIFGALYRTGPMVWTLPYSANVLLRQVGLILILAVIGLKSGSSFLDSFTLDVGLKLFLGGTIISLSTACLMLLVGYKLVKIPFSILMGIVSNQPAILDFAMERSGNNLPLVGYTIMFPISLILKVVFAQLLFLAYG